MTQLQLLDYFDSKTDINIIQLQSSHVAWLPKTPQQSLLPTSYPFLQLAVTLQNLSTEPVHNWQLTIPNPFVKEIKAYYLEQPGSPAVSTYSQSFPQLNLGHDQLKLPQLPFSLAGSEQRTVVLEIDSGDATPIALELKTTNQLQQQQRDTQLFHSILFGIMATLFIYSAFNGILLSDKNYLYACLFTLAYIPLEPLELTYYGQPLLEWTTSNIAFLPDVMLVLGIVGLILLAQSSFIESLHPHYQSRILKYNILPASIALILITASLLPNTIFYWALLITTLFILAASIWLACFYHSARHFLYTWGLLILATICTSLMALKLIPFHIIITYLPALATIFGTTLLSITFTSKMARQQNARLMAIKQLEERQMQLSRRNESLESKVKERTKGLEEVMAELTDANKKLKKASRTDSVTGISNRHLFKERIEVEWNRHLRQQESLTVMMVDLDHFKKLNDTYGHLAGDCCLETVAQRIHQQLRRSTDLVARFGGEEFVIILPMTHLEQALDLAEQIRSCLASEPVPFEGQQISLSASLGVSCAIPQIGQSHAELLNCADQALYHAKSSGRNRVCYQNLIDMETSDSPDKNNYPS